jgi:DNA-binding MarR family transcriptional regulator
MTTRANSAATTERLVLGFLRACHAPITAAELARLCHLSPSTMTRLVKRLEAEGRIRRRRRTRTSSYLEITP